MANYATTKAALDAAIKTNGVQAITGAVLNTILNDILAVLGKHYQFGGLVTPGTAFTAGDEKVAFFAVEAGTYTNFGGVTLDGKTLHILAYDGDWADVDTSIPSGAAFEAALALAIKGSQSGIAEGIADTISAGTAQEFLQRQSGGDGVNCLKRIKGKTIAWNQLVALDSLILNRLSISGTADHITATVTEVANNSTANRMGIPAIFGHSYYVFCEVVSQRNFTMRSSGLSTALAQEVTAGVKTKCAVISASAGSSGRAEIGFNSEADGFEVNDTIEIYDFKIIDLTLLGLGDLTAAQFEALYPALYYAANAGVLKSNDAAALLTDGFNQWDEVWELGDISRSGSNIGQNVPASNVIRSKNYIPVFPSLTYFVKEDLFIYEYDADYNFVSLAARDDTTFGLQPQTAFIRFVTRNAHTTYANDICINLSWSGYRNGEYEPYWQRVLALRLSELTGIPEGGTEADRVTMFPNGLGGAGSAFDSIFVENGVTKARGTMARVNLGTQDWTVPSGTESYFTSGDIAGIKKIGAQGAAFNIISSKYPSVGVGTFYADFPDKAIGVVANNSPSVVVKDSAYSDAATFKAAMDGVYLEYELATPIVYTDLQYADGTPFTMPATILVDNYGTERIQAPEGATTPSAPFCCDSNYSIGVANLVKRLAALENAE